MDTQNEKKMELAKMWLTMSETYKVVFLFLFLFFYNTNEEVAQSCLAKWPKMQYLSFSCPLMHLNSSDALCTAVDWGMGRRQIYV